MEDLKKRFEEWISEKSPELQAFAKRFPTYRTFRLHNTGQKVQVYSYEEHKDGHFTMKVHVLPGHSSFSPDGHMVFGIPPEDLIFSED